MALEYIPGNTLFHRLDPRTKLAWIAVTVLLKTWIPDPILGFLLYLHLVVVIITSRIPWDRIKVAYIAMAPAAVLYGLLNILWIQEGIIIITLIPGRFVLTQEALVFSIGSGITLVYLLTVFRILTLVTTTSDLALGLVKLRLPREFGIALAIGLGYVPVLMEQISSIMDAQRSRGWRFEYRNPIKRGRALFPTLFPTLVNSMYRSSLMAAAMESKGFGYIRQRTYRVQRRFEKVDYVVLVLLLVFLILGIIAKKLGWLETTFTLSIIRRFVRY